MTKKRIADLLKEEVEKTNEAQPATDTSQGPGADTDTDIASTTKASSGTRTRKRASRTSTAAAKKAKPEADNTAELEKQIADLETSLKQAQEQITKRITM